jgi:hypothetical protein
VVSCEAEVRSAVGDADGARSACGEPGRTTTRYWHSAAANT